MRLSPASSSGEGGASLLVSPVTRAAEGLYTCLASNTEGDGHSNAIMLRVRRKYTPSCSGSLESTRHRYQGQEQVQFIMHRVRNKHTPL